MRPDLAALLSLRRGHFLLASGLHGDLSLDRSRLFFQHFSIAPLASELAAELVDVDVDVVCGPLPGGALLAQLVAAELGKKFCYSEQAVNSKYRISPALGTALEGKTVAVVDDVYDTGRAVHETLKELEALGATPIAVSALVVLQAPRRRGTPCLWTRSMWNIGLSPARLTVEDRSVWTPDDCPRCAFGVPLEDVSADQLTDVIPDEPTLS